MPLTATGTPKSAKTRIIHIEERHSEFDLNDTRQIDEIDFCLKGRAAAICQPDNTCKYREIRRIKNQVAWSLNVFLYCSIVLSVDKYRNFSVLDTRDDPHRIAFSLLLLPCCELAGCHFHIRYEGSSQRISSMNPPAFSFEKQCHNLASLYYYYRKL